MQGLAVAVDNSPDGGLSTGCRVPERDTAVDGAGVGGATVSPDGATGGGLTASWTDVEFPDWRVESFTPRAITPLDDAGPVLAMR
jgi:hypothetical protein